MKFVIGLLFISISAAATSVMAGEEIPLYYDAGTYEYIRGLYRDTIFLTDGAVFRHGDAVLKADTAILIKGERIILRRDVFMADSLYQLEADRAEYDLKSRLAEAFGDSVIIISEADSIRAFGTNAYYSRDSGICRMSDRPLLEMNYQDTAQLVQIYADRVALDAENRLGYADGNVIISRGQTRSVSERAIMYTDDEILLLLGEPSARRNESEIKGDTMIFYSEYSHLKKIYVYGHGEGKFREPSTEDSTLDDISDLKAGEIEFNLDGDQLENINAYGQAYSYYFPAVVDSSEVVKNTVSGDTLKMKMNRGDLSTIEVIGGAEGEFLNTKYKTDDSAVQFTEDTVRYKSDYIMYSLNDSTISLYGHAGVQNKTVSLTAQRIDYNTERRLVFAFDDSLQADTVLQYYPVILQDGAEEIIGSYLEYSMVTEKGMIMQSKSDYQEAYYSGKELYRKEKEVYYVDDGTYTTCDANEPHFHFRSKTMKMIQGDKVIARPVVFYIDRMPLMIIPYYVFPTKPGRHSGFLTFKVGNFERGNRKISNVGYYWAASEYWDILGAIDYNETYGITYRSTFRYNVRYRFSGSLSGSFANVSYYSGLDQVKNKRWNIVLRHNHTVSPTFDIHAEGTFLSDKSYYTDYSTNLDDRLNRNIRSQVSLNKRFPGASFSAQFLHEVALDEEKRTDQLPTATFSLSSRPIFGSPGKDEDGRPQRRWYHNLYSGYRLSVRNFSSRTTDTLGIRSRKKYTTADHSSSLSGTFKLLKYLKLNPSVGIQETWYKIYETDQSREAGIDASEFYRRFAYRASISANTDMYGTISPHLFGLEGLRHVLTPSVSYSWAPEITRHNDIRSYTGAGGGGSRSSSLSFTLNNIIQAKIKKGEESKKLDLVNINSSLSYNFEAEGRKFSNLTTRISTSLLKNINLQATLVHDLYKPGTDELRDWPPSLQSLTVSTTFRTGGSLGQYETISSNQTATSPGTKDITGGQDLRWSLGVSHHYSEFGRPDNIVKRHNVNLNFRVSPTPTIDLSYNQTYDFTLHKTVLRQVRIIKRLHCWEGEFYWVPDGSNRGYYFRINVISIPAIKFEKTDTGNIRSAFSGSFTP